MPPSDKNKANSEASDEREEDCSKPTVMETSPSDPATSSASEITLPGHGTMANIPLFTANVNIPTLKCSINEQMKTFDPGEADSNERLNNNQCGSSLIFPVKCSNSLINKNNNKNYKAGSKINKLADMLAKRSQNIVEVTSDIITDFNNVLKTNEPQEVNDVEVKVEDSTDSKTVNDKPVDLIKKSRRKSVPNQSSTAIEPLQLQSNNSKSCSDLSGLFPKTEEPANALEEPLVIKPQTDESTKSKKVIRKNFKNVELSLILPEKKRRSSPRCKKVNEAEEPKLVKNARQAKPRKSKRLVESATQTADIEFISLVVPKTEEEQNGVEKPLYVCLYCTETFISGPSCKMHEKTHVKKKKQLIKCQFCSKKVPSLNELKTHCSKSHLNKYFYCGKCDERFFDKDQLLSHNKEHSSKVAEEQIEEKSKQKSPDLKIDVSFDAAKRSSTSPRIVPPKSSPRDNKTEEQLLEMEMLFYSHLSGNIQENLTNHLDGKIDKYGNPVRTDQIADSQDSGNLLSVVTPNPGVPVIQISRAPSPYQTRSKTPNPLPPTAKKFKKLPNWQQKFWEKYNFPTNYRYEHRFWDKNYFNTEKSALYLKDLSCLDIKTQLTMRENVKKLESIKSIEESQKHQSSDRLTFPDYLSLIPKVTDNNSENKSETVKNGGIEYGRGKRIKEMKKSFKSPVGELPVKNKKINEGKKQPEKSSLRIADGLKMMTRRQSVVELGKEEKKDDGMRRRKGSLDMTGGQKMVLRRQTSLDNLQGSSKTENDVVLNNTEELVGSDSDESSPTLPAGTAEISGEWVRPRSYLCGTCCLRFTNLWELEDHKWSSHPNVWCTHYEFEDDKIDKLFNKNDDDASDGSSALNNKHKLTDLYKRYLLPNGSLKTAKLVPNSNFPEQCTKCKKNCMNSSDLHKHMLDCGGDTTWFLTMYSSPTSMKRKWRPFGSRRRKQIGRRMMKRNIPSTPTLRPYQYQHRIRTKPGDVESIQKMLANLPEKRARRAINFDEIKTRSQATIHSNRLLRKRFKVSFGSSFMRLKNLKTAQQRQLKPVKKESSSKSTTDTSSESTPIATPKKKNRLKETNQILKEESIDEVINIVTEVKEEAKEVKVPKKKQPVNNKTVPKKKKEAPKKKPATKKNSNKPATRSTSTPTITQEVVENNKPQKTKKIVKAPKVKKEPEVIPVAVSAAEEVETTATEEKLDSSEKILNIKKRNILRLRQNDKDKTELIKKIKKKLNNSKRILESKLKSERRRSERIKTLQIPEIPNGVIEPQVEETPVEMEEVKPVIAEIETPKIENQKKSPKRKIDLLEMPILDKEEPVSGKTNRKNEADIPVLMPFENGTEPEVKDVLKIKIVSKKKKASEEKVVKILKETEDKSVKKRKVVKEEPEVIAKTPKAKKYFLGINPNEIDKGGEEKESESDSEPLISLVTPKNTEPEVPVLKEAKIPVLKEVKIPLMKEAKVLVSKEIKVPVVTKEAKIPVIKEAKIPVLKEAKVVVNKEPKVQQIEESKIPLIEKPKNKKKCKTPKKPLKRLKMKVTLKEPTLKIVDKTPSVQSESKWTLKPAEVVEPPPAIVETPEAQISPVTTERRSRRISKETKTSNEFVIDDPLILVDELWSELDSDSDTSKKKSKKGKKKSPKKKAKSDVNLEELLRNFGENKDAEKAKPQRPRKIVTWQELREKLEQTRKLNKKSYRTLSLRLFRFNKKFKNLGNQGKKLSVAKKDVDDEKSEPIPGIPFLASEITENPVQIIQCGGQKSKRKSIKKSEVKPSSNIQLKVSVPLESINNLAVLNNNHLTEIVHEEPVQEVPPVPEIVEPVPDQSEAPTGKTRRSEVIDKIFYCEICKTYYYSSSQLKNHKMSNRHKQKELELNAVEEQHAVEPAQPPPVPEVQPEVVIPPPEAIEPVLVHPEVLNGVIEPPQPEMIPVAESITDLDRINDDTSEMPILEGPFIENPFVRLGMERIEPAPAPKPPPPSNPFGFTEDCLKDIQKAIGCTDEEMLILTLLGENSIEIENDILDLDSCQPVKSSQDNKTETSNNKPEEVPKDNEKSNGVLKVDLKKRMTSALACLVNKAVFNLLQKSGNATKASVNPEALSFLNKLSSVSHKKNILQLNELLKKQNLGESSIGSLLKDDDKRDGQRIPYKYQCTICGSRFEKASTRECHIIRTHRSKNKKASTATEEAQVSQTQYEEDHSDWNDTWSYDGNDDMMGAGQTSQFWCSDCGINFHSPQEVLEHQKQEHQTAVKEPEPVTETGPLQSSTIGSSDEIVEGKKPPPKRRSKHFSTAELDQQRIIANNELLKLDRKFASKNKQNKTKWGMDALKFTVEKENKILSPVVQKEKITPPEEPPKTVQTVDPKNIDIVPKLNLSRTNNIPEFKVIQKATFENRFQKIIENKIKRKCTKGEVETEEAEAEAEIVPPKPPVKKVERKRKGGKAGLKKDDPRKPYDVYDFNESESETEPIVLSHVKKTPQKGQKPKEGSEPSKNKADSTTKDLAPDDYDSEDSLPLAVVKKTKEEDEEEEEEGQKSEGILEQVEYLIEQLEGKKNEEGKGKKKSKRKSESESETVSESFRISLENKFLQLDNIPMKKKLENLPEKDSESSKMSDEEDSLPLKMISKKVEEKKVEDAVPTSNENTPELPDKTKESEENLPPLLSNEIEKSNKAFDTLNGNVIYRRNSVSDFESDFSNEGLIDSEQSLIQEVMEKEDVVIVCSKKDEEEEKTNGKRKRNSVDTSQKKKKIIPLLSATLEENSFRKSESPKLNKEVIVKKIWSRKKAPDGEEIPEGEKSGGNDSQTEIEKEMIMKKIWSRKKCEEGEKKPETSENVKINQTEISDEVVIKCGPKTKASPKRRKSKASNESSKETIMRRIWSGKCTFQTKAALKTYDSDIMPKEGEAPVAATAEPEEEADSTQTAKKRGRQSSLSNAKRAKIDDDKSDEDDLESLLEEIEREDLEKAIRLEFLQLRRSDKGNENVKEITNATVGLFTETCQTQVKEPIERKKKKIRKNLPKNPRRIPQRKKIIKKPVKKVIPVLPETEIEENKTRLEPDTVSELSENSSEKNTEGNDLESKIKSHKHKKHRHKHHHHKHKHKKSKHHKSSDDNKHKNKHKLENGSSNSSEAVSLWEKICSEIPEEIKNEPIIKPKSSKRAELDNLDSKLDDLLLSPFTFDNKTKECEDVWQDGKRNENQSVYEFVDEESDFSLIKKRNL